MAVSYKEFSDAAKKKGMDQSQIDTARGKVVNSGNKQKTNTSTTTTTTNNNSSDDRYGDVSKNGTAGQNKGEGIKTSGGLDFKPTAQESLGDLAKFGADAYTMEGNKSGSLAKRNDIIANNLYLSGQSTEDYLNQFDSFKNASEEDRNNTIRAINERLGVIKKNNEGLDNNDEGLDKDEGLDYSESKAGYYNDGTGEYKVLGYDDLSPDYQKYIDQMSDAERKYISNMWAAGMQEQVKTYLDAMRTKEQAETIQGKKQELYDIQRESSLIQAEQTLRQSKEQVENLKQNWEYLGNMGMPGTSKVKLDAISDSIKEAETTLGEIKRLQNLSLDAQAKKWDIDVTQYTQQIDNLMYDLNWKVSQEIQNALNKYTTAELEGRLDTIDGVTAFKRSLLEELDNNISGLTTGSLQQMQYITQTYQDMADKAYEEAKLYKENANVVNKEMSAVKGYYVDGNGNSILDKNGDPISVPESAPLDPVFDKESGKLIQFYYNEDGSIGATYTQVYDGDQSSLQSLMISMLESGQYTAQDIAKLTGVDLDKVIDLQNKVNVLYRADGLPKEYSGRSYEATDNATANRVINEYIKRYKGDGTEEGGQCGSFVNDYLSELGIGRLYGDYLEGHGSSDKKANMNSTSPVVGGIVIMDSDKCPENGHVAIITGINKENGTIDVLESNWGGDKKVHKNTYKIDSDKIYGYFDPQKSMSDYNMEGSNNENGSGYDSGYIPDFTTFLTKGTNGFSSTSKQEIISQFGSWNNFVKQANAYKAEIDKQVGDVAKMMMTDLYDVWSWLTDGGESGPSAAKMAALRAGTPGKGYEMKSKIKNLLSNQALQKLIKLKGDGATFGALSDKELGFITEAAEWLSLDWRIDRNTFTNELRQKLNDMGDYYGFTSADDFKNLKNNSGLLGGGGNNTTTKDPYNRG